MPARRPFGPPPPRRLSQREILLAVRRYEQCMRNAASNVRVPGDIRLDLRQCADHALRVLIRTGSAPSTNGKGPAMPLLSRRPPRLTAARAGLWRDLAAIALPIGTGMLLGGPLAWLLTSQAQLAPLCQVLR